MILAAITLLSILGFCLFLGNVDLRNDDEFIS